MNELMRDEIKDQVPAIQQCLPSLRSQLATLFIPLPSPRRVVLTGSGDSYFAPLALEYAARLHLKCFVRVLPALEAARYWLFEPSDLLVAISVSGEAIRTVEAARAAHKAGSFVFAITANETSSLAKTSDASLVMPFRSRSRKTPHTTDYATTLLALATTFEALAGSHFQVLETLAAMVANSLEALEGPCREIAHICAKNERFYFLGSGPNFGTAGYGAAKFWEAGGLMALPFEFEEAAHGPQLLLDPGDPVFAIAPTGQSLGRALEVVEGLREIGVNIFAIADNLGAFANVRVLPIPVLAEEWSPFITCLPLQWLCWAIATAKGYDVIRKDGRRANPEVYERVHMRWVRSSAMP